MKFSSTARRWQILRFSSKSFLRWRKLAVLETALALETEIFEQLREEVVG